MQYLSPRQVSAQTIVIISRHLHFRRACPQICCCSAMSSTSSNLSPYFSLSLQSKALQIIRFTRSKHKEKSLSSVFDSSKRFFMLCTANQSVFQTIMIDKMFKFVIFIENWTKYCKTQNNEAYVHQQPIFYRNQNSHRIFLAKTFVYFINVEVHRYCVRTRCRVYHKSRCVSRRYSRHHISRWSSYSPEMKIYA